MTRKTIGAALTLALMASACGRPAPAPNATVAVPPPAGNLAAPPLANTAAPSADDSAAAAPDLTPPALTPEAERGEEGARNILLSFARAIELKRFEAARALLSPADRRKWSSTAFAAMFADLDRPAVAVPGGTMEGAAGSVYYTAPIAITGNNRQGRPVRIEGEAVLRRVNDVDGATAAQRRWHFERLTLDWTH